MPGPGQFDGGLSWTAHCSLRLVWEVRRRQLARRTKAAASRQPSLEHKSCFEALLRMAEPHV